MPSISGPCSVSAAARALIDVIDCAPGVIAPDDPVMAVVDSMLVATTATRFVSDARLLALSQASASEMTRVSAPPNDVIEVQATPADVDLDALGFNAVVEVMVNVETSTADPEPDICDTLDIAEVSGTTTVSLDANEVGDTIATVATATRVAVSAKAVGEVIAIDTEVVRSPADVSADTEDIAAVTASRSDPADASAVGEVMPAVATSISVADGARAVDDPQAAVATAVSGAAAASAVVEVIAAAPLYVVAPGRNAIMTPMTALCPGVKLMETLACAPAGDCVLISDTRLSSEPVLPGVVSSMDV
jgi:hypothetical protein